MYRSAVFNLGLFVCVVLRKLYLYGMLQISELIIYPIKSLGGVNISEALVTDRGLQHDRRWMLVDSQNRFLSQRQVAQMALLKVNIAADGLLVHHQDDERNTLHIPFVSQSAEEITVTVWDDTLTAITVGEACDDWFTEVLRTPCRLVYMPDDSRRATDSKYTPEDKITSLSDGYPFLLIGQSSINHLNTLLPQPVGVNRFRPNIVFTGGEPYEEDVMAHFTINGINFYGVKLCARCQVINIDQQTGYSHPQTLKTLANYRKANNKVFFGQNLIHDGIGTIRIGDELQIVRKAAMPNALNPYPFS